MISFIVPAHNEAAGLGRTLQAIQDSARTTGQPFEVIVVDDASTDATAEVARQWQATVLGVNHRQIAATRNSGGRAARGEQLLFVDADTTINPHVVASALRRMQAGAVGGGAPARFADAVPLYARLLIWWLGVFMRLAGLAGGAFMFCTRAAFQATGGFDERLFGAEDAAFSSALKRKGRFVVLSEHVLTSGRRVRAASGLQVLANLVCIGIAPGQVLTRRSAVEKIWYDSNRQNDDVIYRSLTVRLSNALALVILLVLVTLPVWLVPWPVWLKDSPLGDIRLVALVLLAHVGLVLWPCAWLLIRSLGRQSQWLERLKLTALIAVSLWFAWSSTRGVIWFWIGFCHWLAHFWNG